MATGLRCNVDYRRVQSHRTRRALDTLLRIPSLAETRKEGNTECHPLLLVRRPVAVRVWFYEKWGMMVGLAIMASTRRDRRLIRRTSPYALFSHGGGPFFCRTLSGFVCPVPTCRCGDGSTSPVLTSRTGVPHENLHTHRWDGEVLKVRTERSPR